MNSNIKIGICGEYGEIAKTIRFFHAVSVGLYFLLSSSITRNTDCDSASKLKAQGSKRAADLHLFVSQSIQKEKTLPLHGPHSQVLDSAVIVSSQSSA